MTIQYSVNYAPNGVSQRISLIKHSFFLRKKNPNKPIQTEKKKNQNQIRAMTDIADRFLA